MTDFQRLEQLVTVADAGSLTAAAEELHLSQSALSRSMQRLEAELGLALFDRSRNKIVFNELGKHAVENARGLLREARRFVGDLHDYAERMAVVRIGAVAPAPLWVLGAEIRERFPYIAVAEEQQVAPQLFEGLKEGHFRLILTDEAATGKGILCRLFMEERLVLELPQDHALARLGALSAEDLRGLPVLTYRYLGAWRERLGTLGEFHAIEQSEMDVLEDLARSTELPILRSSLAPSRSAALGGRVLLPILGEAAVMPLYLCARTADRELFECLCGKR